MAEADAQPEELITLELNHQGSNVTVILDLATANVLLNDPNKASEYVTKIVAQGDGANQDCSTSSINTCNQVWINKKPSLIDHEATMLFIQLQQKYSNKFDDRKTIKNQVWSMIAEELNKNGYNVGTGKEAIKRCRQKFANLQKQYFAHVKHMKQTGEKKKNPPPYFSEIRGILGHKHKADPQNLQDSEESVEEHFEENPDEAASSSSSSSASAPLLNKDATAKIKNRFATLKQSVRPPSINSQMMALLQQQHNEDRADRNLQFQSLENLLKQQNEQREKMLSLFEIIVKKRKHSSSDEDN